MPYHFRSFRICRVIILTSRQVFSPYRTGSLKYSPFKSRIDVNFVWSSEKLFKWLYFWYLLPCLMFLTSALPINWPLLLLLFTIVLAVRFELYHSRMSIFQRCHLFPAKGAKMCTRFYVMSQNHIWSVTYLHNSVKYYWFMKQNQPNIYVKFSHGRHLAPRR